MQHWDPQTEPLTTDVNDRWSTPGCCPKQGQRFNVVGNQEASNRRPRKPEHIMLAALIQECLYLPQCLERVDKPLYPAEDNCYYYYLCQ